MLRLRTQDSISTSPNTWRWIDSLTPGPTFLGPFQFESYAFIKRFQHARVSGFKGQATRWPLHLEETSPGTFEQWQIALDPGEYLFEDFGNSFTLLGQRISEDPILMSFPVAQSTA
jgi:hypothetical protein